MLIVTKYGLDCIPYHIGEGDVIWKYSTIREWLNRDFLDAAFSDTEKEMISSVKLYSHQMPDFYPTGDSIQDKVFLLSVYEVNKYLSNDIERQCKPTDYAVANEVFIDEENGNCEWWIREQTTNKSRYISCDGKFNTISANAGVYAAVRPAVWIELGS